MKQRHIGVLGASLIILAAALVVWGVWGLFVPGERTGSPAKEVAGQVSVTINYGTGVPVTGQAVASGTVLDVIKAFGAANDVEIGTKAYPGMGTLVTDIGDKKNGENGAYWQYWMNGVYATSSADNVPVRSGDRIEWKFSDSAQ